MSENYNDPADQLPPDDVDNAPTTSRRVSPDSASMSAADVERVVDVTNETAGNENIAGARVPDASGAADPNDEVPVPLAMWPSEIDERAQVVEALRGNAPPPRTDTQVDPAAEI